MPCAVVVAGHAAGHAAVGYRCRDPVQCDDQSPSGMLVEGRTGAVLHGAAGCDVSRLADVTDQAHSGQDVVPTQAVLQEAMPQEASHQEAKPGTNAWHMV